MSDQPLPPPPPPSEQSVQPPAVAPSPGLTKEMRTNMLNRRSVAWILETTIWYIIFAPMMLSYYVVNNQQMFHDLKQNGEMWTGDVWFSIALYLPYFLVRDQFGEGSWGKKLVGLKVVSDDGGRPSPKDRAVRNILLALPFLPLVEFFVAKGGDKMKRIGDKMAGTSIAEINPDKVPKGSWGGQLLAAIVFSIFLVLTMQNDLIEFWVQKFL